MTDQEKLEALEICKIEDVYKYASDAGVALSILPLTHERVMRLEHALLRLLSEIERKHELGTCVHPKSIEAETAWKLLKEPRYS
jgi:hypothetical protein